MSPLAQSITMPSQAQKLLRGALVKLANLDSDSYLLVRAYQAPYWLRKPYKQASSVNNSTVDIPITPAGHLEMSNFVSQFCRFKSSTYW